MKTKLCNICKKIKDITKFYKYSKMKDELRPICKSCKEKGKLTFICSICNKEHLTNNIQEEIYGDPPEYV
ncbi:hypothetical protein LCGC14_1574660, partial [marine sediment metagenome]